MKYINRGNITSYSSASDKEWTIGINNVLPMKVIVNYAIHV
jgi:hypothetical protein